MSSWTDHTGWVCEASQPEGETEAIASFCGWGEREARRVALRWRLKFGQDEMQLCQVHPM